MGWVVCLHCVVLEGGEESLNMVPNRGGVIKLSLAVHQPIRGYVTLEEVSSGLKTLQLAYRNTCSLYSLASFYTHM